MQQRPPLKSKADILIVDDKPENLRLLNQILISEYKVRLAPSGEKGLDAARSSVPDLILLDVMMPGLNGYEVASTLKSEEQTRDVPIIFISALGEVDDKIRGFGVGGVDFITKPFQEDEVLARVRTHLSIRMLTRQLQDELTERKRAEEKLKDEEARYRAVVENQAELIVRWKLDGKRTFVNQAYLRCFGLTYDQAINTSFLSLVTEDDRSVIEEKIARLNSGQVDSETETHQVVLPDGKVGWQEWTDVAIRDETGAIIEFQSVGRDVTESKWAELVREARSRILQFSVTHTVIETLQKVLDECELLTDSCIGFFHFLLPDQVTIALQTWSTRTLEEYCFAEGKGMHYNLDKAGVWAECVRKGQSIIGNDYPYMPDRKGLPDGHAEVKRFVSIPIMRGSKIVAIVGVGNKETDYTEWDIEVITQLADLTWDIADRKMGEEEIAKERENFLKVFSVAPVGLLLLNDQTEIFQANKVAADLILRDPADLIGKRAGGALMCINSQEDPRGCGFSEACGQCVLRKGVERVLANGGSEHGVEMEMTLLVNNKPEKRWLRISAERLILDGAKHVVVALDDITENKQAAGALRESELRIKMISDSFMDGMIYQLIIQPDGTRTFTYLSESVRKLYGVTPEEGMANSALIYEKIHEDDIENLIQAEEEAIKTLSIFRMEARVWDSSGNFRWSSFVSVPTQLEDGSIRWDGLEFNITELKRVENALRESEKYNSSIVHILPDIIVKTNRSGEYLDIITSLDEKLIMPKAELLGRKIGDVLPARETKIFLDAIGKAMDEDQLQVIEYELPVPAGKIWFEARIVAESEEVFALIRDITERKENERQIFAHQTELQSLLKESDRSRQAMLSVLEDQQITDNLIRRRLAEMEAVNHVSASLRVANTSDEMLSLLLDETLTAMESSAGYIWLYKHHDRLLHMVAGRGWCEALKDMPLQPGNDILGTVFKSGERHISQDIANDPLTEQAFVKYIPQGFSGVCVPIRTAEEVSGVILVSVPLPRDLSAEQVKLLMSLAEMAGTALHRLRLHEETQRSLEYLQALRTIDQAIAANFDSRVTLGILLEQVLAKLHVDAAGVLLFHEYTTSLEYYAGRGFHAEAYKQSNIRLGEGATGRAALDRKIVQMPDLQINDVSPSRESLIKKEGFKAQVVVPLIAKGELKGVLEVFHGETLALNSEWLGFLDALAGQTAIAIDNFQLFEGLQRSNMELVQAYDATIEGWSRALDLRDKETEGHTQRVTDLTVKLAQKMGVPDRDTLFIRRGALLHDIGKMGVPDHILHKPGALTEEEWVIMRRHVTLAYEMLSPIRYLKPALDIPQYHHEKWDGTGYPSKLKREEIPLAARIFAIVDVWDALTNDRPYRDAWSKEKALAYIREQNGKHFDPNVVDAFLRLMEGESF